MKLHFTPRDDFIDGFSTVNIQDLARSCILTVENPSIKSSRGVKCNFTKQPVDQHRLINLYNLQVKKYIYIFFQNVGV